MFQIKNWLKDHSAELTVMAIGLVISIGLFLALGGNISDALAQSRRR